MMEWLCIPDIELLVQKTLHKNVSSDIQPQVAIAWYLWFGWISPARTMGKHPSPFPVQTPNPLFIMICGITYREKRMKKAGGKEELLKTVDISVTDHPQMNLNLSCSDLVCCLLVIGFPRMHFNAAVFMQI